MAARLATMSDRTPRKNRMRRAVLCRTRRCSRASYLHSCGDARRQTFLRFASSCFAVSPRCRPLGLDSDEFASGSDGSRALGWA